MFCDPVGFTEAAGSPSLGAVGAGVRFDEALACDASPCGGVAAGAGGWGGGVEWEMLGGVPDEFVEGVDVGDQFVLVGLDGVDAVVDVFSLGGEVGGGVAVCVGGCCWGVGGACCGEGDVCELFV